MLFLKNLTKESLTPSREKPIQNPKSSRREMLAKFLNVHPDRIVYGPFVGGFEYRFNGCIYLVIHRSDLRQIRGTFSGIPIEDGEYFVKKVESRTQQNIYDVRLLVNGALHSKFETIQKMILSLGKSNNLVGEFSLDLEPGPLGSTLCNINGEGQQIVLTQFIGNQSEEEHEIAELIRKTVLEANCADCSLTIYITKRNASIIRYPSCRVLL